ncbi:MAG: hypothetical protein A2X86_17870 [Bdellovibrionales bacterium GWA2_49_15]|nr:MAG: hypothetical protein A2X86_17870 [Bdellovibrionales bacterium GWA2_49_15]HAZ11592.1 hypothetical protein [Bdellovibrionales bacterium]
MLFPNYIKKNHIVIFIIIEILLMIFGFVLPAKFFVVGFAVALYLFRLGETSEQEVSAFEASVGVYAPVSGKIIDISVQGQQTSVLFQVPWHLSYAIRAPIKAAVEDVKFVKNGTDLFRFSKIDDFYRESLLRSVTIRFIIGHTGLQSVEEVLHDRITLKLFKCSFGLFPDVWIRQGDRCHLNAVIGVIPFGGTVSLSLPLNYEIITKVGEMVIAGSTPIATIK